MKRLLALLAAATALACADARKEDGGGTNPRPPLTKIADGVVGYVIDTAGAPVTNAKVYLVPTSAIPLPETDPLTVTTSVTPLDEPLEDAIGAGIDAALWTTTNAQGAYAIDAVATGSYFLTVVPDDADADHLPGGSKCRTAMSEAELRNQQIDVDLSTAPPASATYVGSSSCTGCHGRAHIGQTMHRLGIWSPSSHGPLQDLSVRGTELHEAIEAKFEPAGGTTVYFFNCNFAGSGFDRCETRETDPGSNVSFTVTTTKNAQGKYVMVFNNVANPSDPSSPAEYEVTSIYGGGVLKQRYMTTLENAAGKFNAVLPLQYQPGGDDGWAKTSRVWRDYNGYKWWNAASSVLKTPGPDDSFEKNCVSCHAVGVGVQKVTDAGTGQYVWKALTVADASNGDFDFDGDQTKEEMNIGCETCHGPGSKHLAESGKGIAIVSPSLLTPEREAMLCGQCHSRPKGALNTDSPIADDGTGVYRMMVAGTSRQAFLQNYATKQLDGATSDFFADADGHSKSHHQQYSDFIRSGMYRNTSKLMTCSECHDPHAATGNRRQLRFDPEDNAAACGSCHAENSGTNLAAHVQAQLSLRTAGDPALGTKHASFANAKCIDCHMPKTAKTGAGTAGNTIDSVQYWQNDITSHLFVVPLKVNSSKAAGGLGMTTPYTKTCGACHTSVPAP